MACILLETSTNSKDSAGKRGTDCRYCKLTLREGKKSHASPHMTPYIGLGELGSSSLFPKMFVFSITTNFTPQYDGAECEELQYLFEGDVSGNVEVM